MEAESSDVGAVISSQQVIEWPLPLGGVGALRAVEAFEFLLPGTTGPGTANSNVNRFDPSQLSASLHEILQERA